MESSLLWSLAGSVCICITYIQSILLQYTRTDSHGGNGTQRIAMMRLSRILILTATFLTFDVLHFTTAERRRCVIQGGNIVEDLLARLIYTCIIYSKRFCLKVHPLFTRTVYTGRSGSNCKRHDSLYARINLTFETNRLSARFP